MIDLFHSIFIGAVQGLSEFLPISSSAHLVIIPYFFGWVYNGLAFDVALHFGTVIAILVFFWNDWADLISQAISRKQKNKNYPINFLWQIVVATIPAAIIGVLLQNKIEKYFHSPLLIAINLAVFGILLWLVDKYARRDRKVSKVTYLQSLIVGTAQSIALVPGVSRSGITILTSRSLGFDRESAARYSFLIGTPAMIGAFLLEIRKVTPGELNLSFFAGIVTSAIVGYFAIKYLLAYLKKGNLLVFTLYRLVLAAIIISVFFIR